MPPLDKNPKDTPERGILDGPSDFVQATAHTFVQTPIDGVTQIFNKVTNQNLHPLELISAPKESNNWTFAGDTVATVGQFVLASKGLRSGLTRAGMVNAAAPAKLWETVLSGTAVDVLHPVADNEPNFLLAKTRSAAIAAGTFAAMGGTSQFLADNDFVRRVGRRGIAEGISLQAFSGAAGGVANAELEAVLHGKPGADLNTLLSRAGQYAAFGAVFGIADATLNKAKVNLTPADNNIARTTALTSEEFIRNNVNDASPMRSPMLTWLAENRPNLRPPNYEAYKAEIVTRPTLERQHLALNDWPIEQRPQVLSEIRKIASATKLSSDANIDAFISRLDIPELKAYASPARVAARTNAYEGWSTASERLLNYVAADSSLNEMPLSKIVKNVDLQQTHPALGPMIEEISAAEKTYSDLVRTHAIETKVEPALNKTLNEIAQEAGLPKLGSVKVMSNEADGTYQSAGRIVSLNDRILRTGLSSATAETSVHEFVHHDYRLGFLRRLFADKPITGNPIGAQIRIDGELKKLNEPGATLNLLQRLGDEESITRRMLSPLPKNVEYYAEQAKAGNINTNAWHETEINKELGALLVSRLINARKVAWQMHTNYVGTPIELPAWSTGFLTNIRSRALGLSVSESTPSAIPISIAGINAKLSK